MVRGRFFVFFFEIAGAGFLSLPPIFCLPYFPSFNFPPPPNPFPLFPPSGCIGPCKYFDFFKLHRKRGTIISTEPRRDIDMRRWFQEGVQLVMDGIVNTSEMITHVYPLERVQEAFDLRNNKDAMCEAIHVLIDCEEAEGGATKDVVVIPFDKE